MLFVAQGNVFRPVGYVMRQQTRCEPPRDGRTAESADDDVRARPVQPRAGIIRSTAVPALPLIVLQAIRLPRPAAVSAGGGPGCPAPGRATCPSPRSRTARSS